MNNFKRSLSWLLSLVMLVSAFCICPVTATAADVWVDSGIDNTESIDSLDANPGRGWATHLKYELNPDGTLNRVTADGLVPYSASDLKGTGTVSPVIGLAAFSKGNSYQDPNAENTDNNLIHVSDHPELVGGVNMNLTDAALNTLDTFFNDARAAGVAVVPRFAYAHSNYVGCEPSYFDLVLYHIQQLGELMTDHSDVILAVEAGMVGPWGEMHTSPYADDQVNRKRDQIDAWLNYLGNDIPVLVRNPVWITQYLDKYASDFMALLPFASSNPASRLGLFNDGYLGDGEDCYTFIKPWDDQESSYNLTRANGIAFLNSQKNVPYGGEMASTTVEHMKAEGVTEWTASKIYSTDFVKELYDSHLTYLRNIGDVGITLYKEIKAHTLYSTSDFAGKPDYSSYYGLDMQKFMYDHMGYRFVLRSAKTMVPSGTNTVKLQGTIENTGFANLLLDSTTQIILIDFMGNEHVYPVNVDANAWDSASTSSYDVTLTLPANATGSYRAFLKVNAANTGIQFANDGTWNSRLKANYIGTFTVGSVPGTDDGENEDVEIDATADLSIDTAQLFAGETTDVKIKADATATITGGTVTVTYDKTKITIPADTDADGSYDVTCGPIQKDGTIATVAVKPVANMSATTSITLSGTALTYGGYFQMNESTHTVNTMVVMSGNPVSITKDPQNTEFNGDGLELWSGNVALNNATGITYVFKLNGVESPIVANNFGIGYTINNTNGTTSKKTNNAAWDFWWQKNEQFKLTFEENGYYFMYVNAGISGVSFISTEKFWIFANLVPSGMDAAYAERANANQNATFQMLGVTANNLQPTVNFYDDNGELITTTTYKYTNISETLVGSDANTRVFDKLATPVEVFAASGATAPTKGSREIVAWKDADGNLVEGVWQNVDLYPVWGYGEADATVTADPTFTVNALSAGQTITVPVLVSGQDFIGATLKVTTSSNVSLTGINTTGTLFDGYVAVFADNIVLNAAAKGSDITEDGVIVNLVLTANSAIANGQTVSVTVEAIDMVNAAGESLGATDATTVNYTIGFAAPEVTITTDADQIFAGETENVTVKATTTGTIIGGNLEITYDPTLLTIAEDTDSDGKFTVAIDTVNADGTVATLTVKAAANNATTASLTFGGTVVFDKGSAKLDESVSEFNVIAVMSGAPVDITKNPENTEFDSDGLELWGGNVALHNSTGVTYIFKVDGIESPVVANNFQIGYTCTTTAGATQQKTNNASWDYWWQKNGHYNLTFTENGCFYIYVNAATCGIRDFISTEKFWIFANLTPNGMDAAYADRANANDNATFQMLGIAADNLKATVNFYDNDGNFITTATKQYTNYGTGMAADDAATRTFGKLATPAEVFATTGATAPTKNGYELAGWADADGNLVEGVWVNGDLYPVWEPAKADATVTADPTSSVGALSAGQTVTVPVLVSGEDFIGATLKVTTSSNVTLTGINTTGTLFEGYTATLAGNIVLDATAKGSDITEDGVIVNLVLTANSAIAKGQTVSVTVEAVEMVNAAGTILGYTDATTVDYTAGFVAPGVFFTTDAEQIFAGETENVTIKAVTTGTIVGGTLEITYDPTVLTIADDTDADGKFTVALDSVQADGTVATIAVKAAANTATTASLTFGGTVSFNDGKAKLDESVSEFNVIAVMSGAPVGITKNPENTEFNSDGLELWSGNVALHNSTGVTYIFKVDGIESPVVANNFGIGYTCTKIDGTTQKKTNNASWDLWWQTNGHYNLTFTENGYFYVYVNAATCGIQDFISTEKFWIFANLTASGMDAAYADRANANESATFQMLGIAADNLEATVKFYDDNGTLITSATKKYTNYSTGMAGNDPATRTFGKLATPAEVFATTGATAPTKDGYVLAGWADADGNLVEGVWVNEDLYPVWEEEEIVEPEILWGDVNGDNAIDGTDAMLLNRYTSGWGESDYADADALMNAGDINADGAIDGTDAMLLNRYTSGWGEDDYADAVNLLKALANLG